MIFFRQFLNLISVLPSRRLLLHAIRPVAAVEDAEPTPHAAAPGLHESGGRRGYGKAEAADEEAPKVEEETRSVVTRVLLLKCS